MLTAWAAERILLTQMKGFPLGLPAAASPAAWNVTGSYPAFDLPEIREPGRGRARRPTPEPPSEASTNGTSRLPPPSASVPQRAAAAWVPARRDAFWTRITSLPLLLCQPKPAARLQASLLTVPASTAHRDPLIACRWEASAQTGLTICQPSACKRNVSGERHGARISFLPGVRSPLEAHCPNSLDHPVLICRLYHRFRMILLGYVCASVRGSERESSRNVNVHAYEHVVLLCACVRVRTRVRSYPFIWSLHYALGIGVEEIFVLHNGHIQVYMIQDCFKCAIQTTNNNAVLRGTNVTVSEQWTSKTDNHGQCIEKGLIVHDPKSFIQPSCTVGRPEEILFHVTVLVCADWARLLLPVLSTHHRK